MSGSSVHGVLVEVEGCGILITGPAGSGKSQLGLELLCRGHRFVADDAVELFGSDGELRGRGFNECSRFLALRCGVVINVARRFGEQMVLPDAAIDLVISPGPALVPFAEPPSLTLAGVERPQHFVQALPGSAICVEALALAWSERQAGYSAAEELAALQARRIAD